MSPIRHSMRERFLFKAGLTLDVLFWLLSLPALLRVHTIPTLLKRLTAGKEEQAHPAANLNDAVGIVTRICNLRLFRARVFPKLCLRQSLALYRTLTQMGYPVEIHFGVRKDDKTLLGHSWVTLRGEVVADTAQTGIFKAVYTYPPARRASALSKSESKILIKGHQFHER
jgi:hypothetical protein